MEELIRLKEVLVRSGEFEVLKDLSVGIFKGQSTVIMGPSGCGKTTLLKVAAGIVPPDQGKVYLGGRDLFRIPEKKMLEYRKHNGFVFQNAVLWANRSIFENLALPIQLHYRKLPGDEVRKKVHKALSEMNMLESASLRPSQLSFGERKVISFLRATILDPQVLYMDDPTPFIDHTLLEKIMSRIKELRSGGCTIIAVTHDARLTALIADFLIIMEKGKILEAGSIDKVRKSTNPKVIQILSEVLSEAATYDSDLLDLLGG